MPYLGLYLAKTEAQSSIWTSKMGAKWNVKFLSDSLLVRIKARFREWGHRLQARYQRRC